MRRWYYSFSIVDTLASVMLGYSGSFIYKSLYIIYTLYIIYIIYILMP